MVHCSLDEDCSINVSHGQVDPQTVSFRIRLIVRACLYAVAILASNAYADNYPASGGISIFSGSHVYNGSGTVTSTGNALLLQTPATYGGANSPASITINPNGGTVSLTSSNSAAAVLVSASGSGNNTSLVIGPGTVNIVAANPAGSYAMGVSAGGSAGSSASVDLGKGVNITTAGTNGWGIWSTSNASVTADGITITTTGSSSLGAGTGGNGKLVLSDSSVSTSGRSAYGLVNRYAYGLNVGQSTLDATNVSVTTQGDNAAAVYLSGAGSTRLTNVVGTTYGAAAPGIFTINGATLSIASESGGSPSAFSTSGAESPALQIYNTTPVTTTVNATGTTLHATGSGSPGALLTGVAGSTEILNLADSQVAGDQSDAIQVEGPSARISLTNNSVVTAGAGAAALNVVASTNGPGEVQLNADHSTLSGSIQTDATSTSDVVLTNGSIWNVTGNSVLSNLTNESSTLSFVPSAQLAASPQSNASYASVNVRNDYAGDGGNVKLNTYLNAGGALSSQFTDRLLISGNASGSTVVEVEPAPGSVGSITSPTGTIDASDGISVIQVAGTSTSAAFHLQGGYVTAEGSPYQYRLYAYGPTSVHGGADPSQSLVGNSSTFWDYRLQTAFVTPDGTVDPDGPDTPSTPGTVTPAPEVDALVPPGARLAVAPQVASYLTAPAAILYAGFADIDTLHRRLGEVRDDRDLGRDADAPGEVFIRAYGGHFDYSTNLGFASYGYNATGDYSAVQFGTNVFRHRDSNDGIWRFGLAATLGWLHYVPQAVDGNSSTRTNTYRLSGYGTYQSQQGWYVDSILSVGFFDGDVTTDARGETFNLHGTGYAASLEAGYPFVVGGGFNLEPQLQLVGQHLSLRNDVDADELPVNIGSQNQLLGRMGLRLTHPYDTSHGRITPYAAVDILHSFSSGTNVQIGGTNFTSGDYGGAVQLSIGANGTVTDKVSLYGRVSWQQSIGDAGFRGWLFNAGAKVIF